MIDLSNITLVIYDDFRDDPTESNIRYIILKKVLEYYKDVINFYDILQFTPEHGFTEKFYPVNIANFLVERLPNKIRSTHYLHIQWDGFIINPNKWEDKWLNYDYIGGGETLQSSGFSLKKTSTMVELSKPKYTKFFKGYSNDDSYYSMFFDGNIHPMLSQQYDDIKMEQILTSGPFPLKNKDDIPDWKRYRGDKNIIFENPFGGVLSPNYDENVKSDSDNFCSFLNVDRDSFGFHIEGSHKVDDLIKYYQVNDIFTDSEINLIYERLNEV